MCMHTYVYVTGRHDDAIRTPIVVFGCGGRRAPPGAAKTCPYGIEGIDVCSDDVGAKLCAALSGVTIDAIIKDWRLNERHYGALQGKDKKETVAEFGEAQVKVWRRSYDVPPPPVVAGSKYDAKVDPLYAGIDASTLPECECLKDTVERCLPLWDEQIAPALQRGETVLVAAHGNSIRGLLKFLDGISEDEITGVEIPSRSRSCTTSTRSCGPSRRRAASRRFAVPSSATPRQWPRPRPRWRPRRRWPSRRRLPCSTPSSTSCWQRRRPSSSTTPAWRRSSRTTGRG